MRRLSVLLILILASTSRPAGAADPSVFLTWKAPFGSPGAVTSLIAPCAEGAETDTLYMSFRPHDDAPTLYGVGATLLFRALPGDSLDRNWWFGEGLKDVKLEIQFPDSAWPGTTPWMTGGMGWPKYDRTRGSGRLQIIYAVPSDHAASIRGGAIYNIARLLVRRPRPSLARCQQAVCIEWAASEFSFELGVPDATLDKASRRFVSWNSPRADACASYSGVRAAPSWKPKRAPGSGN